MRAPRRCAVRIVRLRFASVQHLADRLRATAQRERLTVASLITEALHIHLHKLETRGDPKLRRKSVCWSCGDLMDAATGGTAHARSRARRTTKS